MIPETFSDGIGTIGYAGGVVRVDFVSFSSTERGPDGNPLREPRHRLVLTEEAFLETLAAFQQLHQRLLEVKNPAAPPTAAPADIPPLHDAPPSDERLPPTLTSPNFPLR